MTASLLFDGTLELRDPKGKKSAAQYWFDVRSANASFGDPQPIEATLGSLLRFGAIVVHTGDDNREANFYVKVKATTSAALDDGIAALHRATRKRTTLRWKPPDGLGPVRIWDVETSNLLEADGFDDYAQIERLEAVFRLRLVCQPYRRGETLIVDDAGTPPSSGDVVYDPAGTDTGWSKWSTWPGLGGGFFIAPNIDPDTTLHTEGTTSSVRCQSQTSGYSDSTHATRYLSNDKVEGLSIDTGTGGYLAFPIRTVYGDNPEGDGLRQLWVTTAAGEQEVTGFFAATRDAFGFVRYVCLVEGGLTITGARFLVVQTDLTFEGTAIPYVNYGAFELSESATTDHQIVKQHDVQGSAPTTGSIRIAAPSESIALGPVLVATMAAAAVPPGFQIDARRWLTQGDTANDPALGLYGGDYLQPDSSSYSDATGSPDRPVCDVPISLLNAGEYSMVAVVQAVASSLTFGVRAQLLVDGTTVGPTSEAEITAQGLDTGWQILAIGAADLSPLPMQNADDTTKVRLLFKGAKFADVYFIPAWQDGGWPVADFTIVDCGSGTVEPGGASSSLYIDSPDSAQSEGGFWRGPTADRRNAQSAWPDVVWPGVHTFKPGPLLNFVVSLNAAGPTSTLSYYDRYL